MELHQLEVQLGGGSLLQIANRTQTQMMSYLITAPSGEVIMIDGGNYCAGDADHLYEELKKRGGHVRAWFFTHAHNDHNGALTWMLEKYETFDLQIDAVYMDYPAPEYLERKEDAWFNKRFLEELDRNKLNVVRTHAGDLITVGGMAVEVLNDAIVREDLDDLNQTGIVLLAHFPQRDILFLGDFHEYVEKELLEQCGPDKLRKDIVQMAHHGQNGVSRAFYELIRPKICLFDAPLWLWENYLPEADPVKGSGPFKTLEVRSWMEAQQVETYCVHAFGDHLLF